jgi:ion channel-forming bestrophin family protein
MLKFLKNSEFQFLPLIFTKHHQPIYQKLKRTTIYLILYSIFVVVFQIFYEKWFDKLQLDHIGQFHVIFSFVLAILIGFRINTAYARWWEARSFWGALVNNSRSLAIKFNAYIGLTNNQDFLAYLTKLPALLKHHLCKEKAESQKIMTLLALPVSTSSNMPSTIVNEMYRIINQYRIDGKLSLEQYLSLDQHLANIIDVVGGCEKIANTPVPSLFKIFVRQALFFYMVSFPFGWVEKFGFLIIPMMIVIVDILLGLELVSENIEAPFEDRHDEGCIHSDLDLKLDNISRTIADNVQAIALQTK